MWDLFRVLAALRSKPLEPPRRTSFKRLFLKTDFFVALASGRRSSEAHAFSGLERDTALDADGSITLRSIPEFLAKNQEPSSPSPTISIRPLTPILEPDDEDRFLSPARGLRRYLAVTKHRRSSVLRRLFSFLNEGHNKNNRKTTQPKWLVDRGMTGLVRWSWGKLKAFEFHA